ncbi:hypothetical protein EV382_3241 [Micromonospora violae]|uniref:Uncharacterized protein n=1 Tax=Micromonospora violae TaxID=1278207 RepID=A0A4Q7UK73_9ACTN|nr:hypothetical protein EV382_3241 [Micromonospora violae]
MAGTGPQPRNPLSSGPVRHTAAFPTRPDRECRTTTGTNIRHRPGRRGDADVKIVFHARWRRPPATCSAINSYDRTRSCTSYTSVVNISSSAPVRSTSSVSCRRTVSGEPIA